MKFLLCQTSSYSVQSLVRTYLNYIMYVPLKEFVFLFLSSFNSVSRSIHFLFAFIINTVRVYFQFNAGPKPVVVKDVSTIKIFTIKKKAEEVAFCFSIYRNVHVLSTSHVFTHRPIYTFFDYRICMLIIIYEFRQER